MDSTRPLRTRRDFERALRALLDAAEGAPGIDALAALRDAVDPHHSGFRADLDAAVARRVDAELGAGTHRTELARALGVRPSRVSQLRAVATGGAGQRYRRGVAPEQLEREARERARAWREQRRAESACLGAPFLERADEGVPVTTLAQEAGVSRQRLASWLSAARAARTAS